MDTMESFCCTAYQIQDADKKKCTGRGADYKFVEAEIRVSGQRRVHYSNRKTN